MDAPTTPEPARPTRRRPPTTVVAIAAFAAGSILSGAGAVWAGHQFSDVPGDSPFHNDIDWMVDQGIADGYVDGTFKPASAVSRQAMSAFMHRLSNRTIVRREIVATEAGSAASFQVAVDCLPGERAIGGTGEATNAGATLVITDSRPLGPFDNPDGWVTVFQTRDGSSVDPVSVIGYATCVPGF